MNHPRDTWLVQSVKPPMTLGFSSDCDLRVLRSSPAWGSAFSMESAWDSLPVLLVLLHVPPPKKRTVPQGSLWAAPTLNWDDVGQHPYMSLYLLWALQTYTYLSRSSSCKPRLSKPSLAPFPSLSPCLQMFSVTQRRNKQPSKDAEMVWGKITCHKRNNHKEYLLFKPKTTWNTERLRVWKEHVLKALSWCLPVQPSHKPLWTLFFWRSSQYLFIEVILLTTKQKNVSMGVHFTLPSVPLCFTFWVGPFEVGPVVNRFTSMYFSWGDMQRRKMASQSLWGEVYASFPICGDKHCNYLYNCGSSHSKV